MIAKNYCRNPEKRYNGGPLCFTMDANTSWERCAVPMCNIKSSYMGFKSETIYGRTCQKWASQIPHKQIPFFVRNILFMLCCD